MAWKGSSPREEREFGVWGYGVRAMELTGFLVGGLLAPLALIGAPMCSKCSLYKRVKPLGMTPFASEGEAVSGTPPMEAARKQIENLRDLAEAGDSAGFRTALDSVKARQDESPSARQRFALELLYCRDCAEGNLQIVHLSGRGRSAARMILPEAAVALTPDFVRSFADRES